MLTPGHRSMSGSWANGGSGRAHRGSITTYKNQNVMLYVWFDPLGSLYG